MGCSDSKVNARKSIEFHVPQYAPELTDRQLPAFMRTAAPNGQPWYEYVDTDSSLQVDEKTGFLEGRWAECLCWAVYFEWVADRACDGGWAALPEYAEQGPVDGVCNTLGEAASMHDNCVCILKAAGRLWGEAYRMASCGLILPINGVTDAPWARSCSFNSPQPRLLGSKVHERYKDKLRMTGMFDPQCSRSCSFSSHRPAQPRLLGSQLHERRRSKVADPIGKCFQCKLGPSSCIL